MIGISFFKLVAVAMLSLFIEQFWTNCYGDQELVVQSCTSTELGSCKSYCNDVSISLHTISDDVYHTHSTDTGFW